MNDAVKLGGKVRALRRRDGMSQVDLATKLGISSSYLNLIESNKRPLPAAVLIKLAQVFNVDLSTFASPDDARLAADLSEAFIDPIFDSHPLTNTDVPDFPPTSPAMPPATLTPYQTYPPTPQ